MPTSDECKNTSDELYGYIAKLLADQPFFKNLVGGLKAGNVEISMFRKLVNKKIEEEWIDAIEACILPLDKVIRRPSRYIEELDEVKPIELSRNITSRSIQHLAQHTDYISEVKGDEITPSKILNVFHEETLLTYENRFINTLIRQLYLFVNKRYNEMVKNGAENSTQFDISAEFRDGTLASSVRFGLTVSESAEGAAEADPLLKRVMRLNSVVTMYYNSPFAKSMNGAYVRPPVMRTNALMKNRDLRQCLELWQFIEGYEKVGYSISVEQKAEKPDRALIERMYADLALQYTVFRREIAKAADTLAEEEGVPFQPLIVQDIKPVEQKKFNLSDCVYRKVTPVSYVNPPRKLSRDELKIRKAVDEALELDAYMKKHDLVEEAKRRIAEEARRRAAEKAREEARLKAEEDARAVAEYYASLGYRVRLKTQASKTGELIFEPTNAADTLTEAVEALEGAITGGAEEEAAIADGMLMSDEEIASRTADGDMPALDEILGKRYLKAGGGQRGGRVSARLDGGEKKAARGGFVIARMVPTVAASSTMPTSPTIAASPTIPAVTVSSTIPTGDTTLTDSDKSDFSEPLEDRKTLAETKTKENASRGDAAEAVALEPSEGSASSADDAGFINKEIAESALSGACCPSDIEKAAVSESVEDGATEETGAAPFETVSETSQIAEELERTIQASEAEAQIEATEQELAQTVARMSEEERATFEKETLGLTSEEKLAYRKLSRAKRRVLKKIAETRRRKMQLRLENERRAAAAMEKEEKLRCAASEYKNYTSDGDDGEED